MKKKSLFITLCLVLSLGFIASCSSNVEENSSVSGEISVEKSAEVLKNKEILPIGTIVQLKTGKTKLMINGYLQVESKNKNKLYDYAGVLYPQGQLNTEESYLFNADQISRIYYIGYQTKEQKKLNNQIAKLKKENG